MIRAGFAATLLLVLSVAWPAMAQIESREGIALQNQLLQLRQEIDMLRRGGAGGGAAAPVPVQRPSGSAGSPEILAGLLDRVSTMEEEVRRLRGRADEAEFRSRTLAEQITKLQGDMDFRLQALEGGNRPAAPAPSPGAPPPAPRPPPATPLPSGGAGLPPPAAAPGRPPERALQEGQAALGRRDYPVAETAAREVLASRPGARAQDAGILLGEALVGKREFQSAALAFDDAYRRNPQSGRAPEALLGLATSFAGFNARREACATLDQLRSEFPRLTGPQTERSQALRSRAQCR